MKKAVFFAVALFLPGAPCPGADPGEATLVVYSTNDPLSGMLAKLYAMGRGVPEAQIVGLNVSAGEEITREEYRATIERPLRDLFNRNGWWKIGDLPGAGHVPVENKIRYVALMRGMPLKVVSTAILQQRDYESKMQAHRRAVEAAGTGPPPSPPPAPPQPAPMAREEASVDSEIAALGFLSNPLAGPLANPYFRSFLPITSGEFPFLLLVCRLDGPDADVAHRMITDSLVVEKSGVGGVTYIDRRDIQSAGYKQGDEWLVEAATASRNHGLPTLVDNRPGIFPAGYSMRDVGLYLGWYADHVDGPFLEDGFRFRRGAVAVHIHSFSAETVRTMNRRWAGPLLARGALATTGNVYEPYLDITPHLDIFANRLFNGFTLAEAAFMSMRGISWMAVVFGDPLYRPYAAWSKLETDRNDSGEDMKNWRNFRSAWLARSRDPQASEKTIARLARDSTNPVFLEALAHAALAEGQADSALRWFREAEKIATATSDRTRIRFHMAEAVMQRDSRTAAYEFVRRSLDEIGLQPAMEVLAAELAPPPPAPATDTP